MMVKETNYTSLEDIIGLKATTNLFIYFQNIFSLNQVTGSVLVYVIRMFAFLFKKHKTY